MGMYDVVRSSYPLPEPFMGVNQTKDIEDFYSGTMTEFWIDPDGYLWYGDYWGTSTFEHIPEDDPRYDDERKFLNFEWVPTGEHGKYHVHPITKYVEIYPEQFDGAWEDYPRLRLHFKSGRLIEWEDVTGR
jgi:hypothetical protein